MVVLKFHAQLFFSQSGLFFNAFQSTIYTILNKTYTFSKNALLIAVFFHMFKPVLVIYVVCCVQCILYMYTPQKMFLLAFSFAHFETTRGNTGKANISQLPNDKS